MIRFTICGETKGTSPGQIRKSCPATQVVRSAARIEEIIPCSGRGFSTRWTLTLLSQEKSAARPGGITTTTSLTFVAWSRAPTTRSTMARPSIVSKSLSAPRRSLLPAARTMPTVLPDMMVMPGFYAGARGRARG